MYRDGHVPIYEITYCQDGLNVTSFLSVYPQGEVGKDHERTTVSEEIRVADTQQKSIYFKVRAIHFSAACEGSLGLHSFRVSVSDS